MAWRGFAREIVSLDPWRSLGSRLLLAKARGTVRCNGEEERASPENGFGR